MRSFAKRCGWLLIAGALAAMVLAPQPVWAGFYLHKGDRVVFYGDSITEQRLYTTDVEVYCITRFPKLNLSFINAGVGGDRVTGGWAGPIDLRLKRDVFPYKPSVVTIMLGMNDGGYRPFDENLFNTYRSGYEHIIASLEKHLPGVRITLIEPSPFDDITRAPGWTGGYNGVLLRYCRFVRQLARRDKLAVTNFNTPVVNALKEAVASNATLAQKIVPDRVHPAPGGHLIMAAALLKTWGAPSLVSSVSIDVTNRHVETDNAKVQDLTIAPNAISWHELDGSLPMPIDLSDPVTALAVNSSDVIQELNQQPLKVEGLAEGNYRLAIDGVDLGTYTPADFDQGINLAMISDNPSMKQAAAVQNLAVEQTNIEFIRWRNVQIPLQNVKSRFLTRALSDLQNLEYQMIGKEQRAAQPIWRTITITKL